VPLLGCAPVARSRRRGPAALAGATVAITLIDIRLAGLHQTGVPLVLDACATIVWLCAIAILTRRVRADRDTRHAITQPVERAPAPKRSAIDGVVRRDVAARPPLAHRRRDAGH
jgi:hypothetical protein